MNKAKDFTERTGGVAGTMAAAVGGAAGVVAGVVESFRGEHDDAGTRAANSPMSGADTGADAMDEDDDDMGASVADDDDDDPTGM
jgi:hypothetical protein